MVAVFHAVTFELTGSASLLVKIKHLAVEARVAFLQIGRTVGTPIKFAFLAESIQVDETFDTIIALGTLLVFTLHAVEAHLLVIILVAIVAKAVFLLDVHAISALLASC